MYSYWTPEVLQGAAELNDELRRKYPLINTLLNIAERMPKRIVRGNSVIVNNTPPVMNELVQDTFGILATVLLKKNIINTIEQFIDYVEEVEG